jgi:hypothetical protein
LAARSSASHFSSTRPTTSVPLASPPVVPPAARGESGGLHYDHCGRDGHVKGVLLQEEESSSSPFFTGY